MVSRWYRWRRRSSHRLGHVAGVGDGLQVGVDQGRQAPALHLAAGATASRAPAPPAPGGVAHRARGAHRPGAGGFPGSAAPPERCGRQAHRRAQVAFPSPMCTPPPLRRGPVAVSLWGAIVPQPPGPCLPPGTGRLQRGAPCGTLRPRWNHGALAQRDREALAGLKSPCYSLCCRGPTPLRAAAMAT